MFLRYLTCVMIFWGVSFGWAQASPPTTRLSNEMVEQLRTQLEEYYAREFGAGLAKKNRLIRLIAVVSLSKIDADSVTEKLLEAAEDRDPIVAQVAWDVIHARHQSLTETQRQRWLQAGITARTRGAFPGKTALDLLGAVAGYGYPADARILAEMIADTATDSQVSALRPICTQLLNTQPQGQWLRLLVQRMQGTDATRIDAVLRDLPDAPSPPEKTSQYSRVWRQYALSYASHQPLPPEGPYTGTSRVFPKPEKIEDPESDRWRQELELPEIPSDRIELVYCIDSTGSMDKVNKMLASTVQPLTMALGLCASDIRAGAVYYRHEIAKELMKDCCLKAQNDPNNHTVLTIPLSKDINSVVRAMRSVVIHPKVGHFRGTGAYAAALQATTGINWSRGKNTQRIVVVIGDAPPTDGTHDYAAQFAELLKENDVRLYFLSLNKGCADSIRMIAQAGGSSPVPFESDMKLYDQYVEKNLPIPLEKVIRSNIGMTVTRLLRESVPDQYGDRIELILSATLPIIQAQLDMQ
ncbi:MAG: hypothetical protein KatS3mg104_2524 [Phycisphaerae bacterium]|jgi:hypothetical protein|nr:MAG: hypothetical protein KatS3mg104_2524 [Phycisphaerae bacterium]